MSVLRRCLNCQFSPCACGSELYPRTEVDVRRAIIGNLEEVVEAMEEEVEWEDSGKLITGPWQLFHALNMVNASIKLILDDLDKHHNWRP